LLNILLLFAKFGKLPYLCIVLVQETLRQQQRRAALGATLHNIFNRKDSRSSFVLQILLRKNFNKRLK